MIWVLDEPPYRRARRGSRCAASRASACDGAAQIGLGGTGVAHPQVRTGRLGREPSPAGADDDLGIGGAAGEDLAVDVVGEPQPQVHPARRHERQAGVAEVAAQRGRQHVAPEDERLADPPQVPLPRRGVHDLERRLLHRPRDEELGAGPAGGEPRQSRAPGGDGADSQSRGHRLGQRAQVDAVTVPVVADERPGRRLLERQVAAEVIFDHQRAVPGDDVEHLAAAGGGQRRAARVGVQRLGVEHARTGRLEGARQQFGHDAVGVGGYRHEAQAGGASGDQRAHVRRRLDEHRRPRFRQGMERRGDRCLRSRTDDHLARGHRGPELAGEPRAQAVDALERHASPHPRPARCSRQRPRHEVHGLEILGRIPAGEIDGTGRRPGQQRRHVVGGDAAGAERDALPGEIGGLGRIGRARGQERAVSGPCLEHALVGQPRHRLPDCAGADPVTGHQGAHRRQTRAGGQPARFLAQGLKDARYAATLSHEDRR